MPLADIATLEVRESAAGNVPNGPPRWARAYRNAAKRPNSYGAKLFNWRTSVAMTVAQTAGVKDQPYVLVHRQDPGDDRREYACSPACATLLMQLATNDDRTVEQYVDILVAAGAGAHGQLFELRFRSERFVEAVNGAADASCRVCAQPIASDKRTVKAIEQKTADVVTYVLVSGALVPVGNLKVVDLTDEQHTLLSRYAEVDGRERYVNDHGRRFDA